MLQFDQSKRLKIIKYSQKTEADDETDGKAFCKLMRNATWKKYLKKKKKMRNTVGVRLLNNKQSYLKQTSKPSFVTKKIFGNNFVAIHEIKNILMFNELVYV